METPRPLDHLVMPTADLGAARRRLSALGFTVAPIGVHPFGTANCCVYFADGTFLEPLAQDDDRSQREAARLGNVFAARDQAYRYRNGEEGASALVFGTEDAAADHEAFIESGFSAGAMLDFSRDFVDASGQTDKASFRLAFAADLRAPDLFAFTCQRIGVPKADRGALQRHSNGVVAIKRVVLSAPHATDFADFIMTVADVPWLGGGEEMLIRIPNCIISLCEPADMERQFGTKTSRDEGLRLTAVVFAVDDLAALQADFRRAAIIHTRRGSRLVVPPAPGQGAIFAFEAP